MFRRTVALCACALVLVCTAPMQAAVMFDIPDAPLPPGPGDGLSALVWTNVDTNTLAAARAFIGANPADSSFTSTVVDYPNGSTATVMGESTIFNTVLGVDAPSLSDPTVGNTLVLNSILQFTGFIRVDVPGSLFLGVASDDGSELRIQGTQILNNDGIHPFPGPGAGPVEVEFSTAGLYEVEVLFFESEIEEWGVTFFEDTVSSPVDQSLLYTVPEPAAAALLTGVGLWVMTRRR